MSGNYLGEGVKGKDIPRRGAALHVRGPRVGKDTGLLQDRPLLVLLERAEQEVKAGGHDCSLMVWAAGHVDPWRP